MKTVVVGLLFVSNLALNQAALPNWSNAYEQPLNFTCPDGQIIGNLHSIHDNTYDDRIWEIECRSVSTTSDWEQSDWVNDWDRDFVFRCPDFKILTGIESYYDSTSRDRRYKFACSTVNSQPSNTGCVGKNYSNEYDGPLTLNVTGGYGISTIYGINSNVYNDRQFYFGLCKI